MSDKLEHVDFPFAAARRITSEEVAAGLSAVEVRGRTEDGRARTEGKTEEGKLKREVRMERENTGNFYDTQRDRPSRTRNC